MQSRTAEGKHTKRFIVLVQDTETKKWERSINDGLTEAFATREEALAAIDPSKGLVGTTRPYKVRQK
jgi:hypothetical protein